MGTLEVPHRWAPAGVSEPDLLRRFLAAAITSIVLNDYNDKESLTYSIALLVEQIFNSLVNWIYIPTISKIYYFGYPHEL